MFTTLLAIINPLEALPVFLKLLEGRDDQAHRQVAPRSCFYAMLLMFFFLISGTLILRVFGVPLSGPSSPPCSPPTCAWPMPGSFWAASDPRGIDAATRLVGIFVSTMGMGLIFHGVIEALQSYALTAGR